MHHTLSQMHNILNIAISCKLTNIRQNYLKQNNSINIMGTLYFKVT